jgi:glutamate racemase
VLACNTASAQALRRIQQEVMPKEFPDRRLLGVVRPLAEAAAGSSGEGHFGVIGTKATAKARAYTREILNLRPEAKVTEVAAPGLAGLIEEGREAGPEAESEVVAALDSLTNLDGKIDTVLLACTHFPLAYPLFEKHRPAVVRYLMQDAIVAERLADYLARHPEIASRLDAAGESRFATTGDAAEVTRLATRFFCAPAEFERVAIG